MFPPHWLSQIQEAAMEIRRAECWACVLAEGGGIVATWLTRTLVDVASLLALGMSRYLDVHRDFL